eukprot:gb/GECH01014654.1/.p1 GENE.gb/GECH01014654.1/~~gb/GECH01014654.1/.p1  ORF type:complete len:382 (+),score=96.15 gb/GECH01014654.1/:1-1146(+)
MAQDIGPSSQAIVIDNGSGTIKAGFSGDDLPKHIFSNFVGRPRHKKVMMGGLEGDYFIGDQANEWRGLLSLKYPMEHGIVEDWNDMEKIWSHIYPSLQISSPDDYPVFLTETPLNPNKNRESMAEIFFETFRVPSLFISVQAVLSLYASGKTDGVVLDSGDGVTYAVPIFGGYTIPNAITRVDVAGRDITNYLMLLLRKGGYRFHTSAEREIVRSVKEEMCYVPFSLKKEDEIHRKDADDLYDYKLPDGETIRVGSEKFRAPEVLFNPALIGLEYEGVHNCLMSAIQKSDIDIRKKLYSSIILSGGSTLFKGFGDRLLMELRTSPRTPKDVKLSILAQPERKYSAWIGGSILSSLASFSPMWFSRSQYQEEGAYGLHARAL